MSTKIDHSNEESRDDNPNTKENVLFTPAAATSSKAALREYANRLKEIIDFLPDATTVIDSKKRVLIWNKALEKMSGLKAKDLIGVDNPDYTTAFYGEKRPILMDYLLETDDISVLNRYANVAVKGDAISAKTYCPGLRKGNGAWIFVKISVLRDAKGKIIGAIQTMRDITEQEENIKKLNIHAAALATAKANDDAILSNIGEGLIAIDTQGGGRISLINEQAEKMLGVKLADVKGKPFTEVVTVQDEHGNNLNSSQGLLCRALKEGARESTSITEPGIYYVRKDGTRFPVATNAAPIRLHGDIIGAVEVFRDITRDKEIDKQKDEFISLASHQLRTPTTIIRWYCELILEEHFSELTPKQKEYIAAIDQGSKRMIELVNALLAVSRIELNAFAIKPRSVNVAGIVEEVLVGIQPLIVDKNITIKNDYKLNVAHIKTDPALIRIIVQNLITNAVEYSDQHGSISIKLTQHDSKVKLSIHDHGCGIPKVDQKKIFTKFFRSDRARGVKPDGNGLGLYISKLIANAVKGTISFSSTRSEGTIFNLTLPVSANIKKTPGEDIVL